MLVRVHDKAFLFLQVKSWMLGFAGMTAS